MFFPRIRQKLLCHPFFLSKAAKHLKNVISWCIQGTGLCFTFFFLPVAMKCLLKNATSWWVLSRFPRMASESLWMQYFTKNWACMQSFHRKYCTIKDGTQTYNFIADKSCLLFAIILDILSGWEVIRTHGKCIKSYKDVWKDFVVEQNLTRLKGNFWSYLNRPYDIVVVWDDETTGNMDPRNTDE